MSNTKQYLLAAALFLGIGCALAQTPKMQEKDFLSRIFKNDPAYLFCGTTPQNNGLVFNYSYDGLLWKKAGNGATYFKPAIGFGKYFMDPSIVRGTDGTFHMVWATDSTKGSIGYVCSKDLKTWTGERILTIGAGSAQSPELFYHKATKRFYLIWGSASKTLYYSTTKDFVTFEPIKPLYNADYEVTDPYVFKKHGSYFLFFKNDNDEPLEKNIYMASSLNLKNFKSLEVETLTGTEPAKGPSAITIGKYIYLYYNNYNTSTYRVMRCRNLNEQQWEDVTPYMNFPGGKAQGSIFKVDDTILHDLQAFRKE